MKNSYNYTVPDISSLEDNEIKEFSSVELIPQELRIVHLNGSFARIEVNTDGYCELSSYDEVDINEEDKKIIESLMKNFFYGKAYLFGVVNEGNFLVYDIRTNDNYFSYRDLQVLNKIYGLKLAETFFDGYIHYDDLISLLNSKIETGLLIEDLHILPSMYLNDKREYETIKEEVVKSIIVGEKPAPKVYNTWSGSSSGYCGGTYRPSTPAVSTPPATNSTAVQPTKEQVEENNKKEAFRITTKDERTAIFQEVLKNLTTYINAKVKTTAQDFVIDFWNKHGVKFAYLYAIYSLPKTRHIIYNFIKDNKTMYEINGYLTSSEIWAEIFLDFFETYHSVELKNFVSKWDDYVAMALLFQEEFEAFETFYEKEVPENDKLKKGGYYDVY